MIKPLHAIHLNKYTDRVNRIRILCGYTRVVFKEREVGFMNVIVIGRKGQSVCTCPACSTSEASRPFLVSKQVSAILLQY